MNPHTESESAPSAYNDITSPMWRKLEDILKMIFSANSKNFYYLGHFSIVHALMQQYSFYFYKKHTSKQHVNIISFKQTSTKGCFQKIEQLQK